jgi:predicted aminopeptidase
LLACFAAAAYHHSLLIYLVHQGKGQLHILMNTETFEHFLNKKSISMTEKEKLEMISNIKKYSVDSLEFLPTKNFARIYDQQNKPSLWVITASERYALRPYEWSFPLIGTVSYKGYFDKGLAAREYLSLINYYDVELRPVSAWSTLGWFSDPVLSNILSRKKGVLCNLIFHELFHATYFAPGEVELNENLANFIAHKATLMFLSNDSAEIKQYLDDHEDNRVIANYMERTSVSLALFYDSLSANPQLPFLKKQKFSAIADSFALLPVKNKLKLKARLSDLASGNACFVDYRQYESLQDSLEIVFNKFYKGDLKKMVRDLKLN